MRHLVSEAFYKNAKLTRSVIQRVWEFPTCKRLDENSVPDPACQVVKRVKIVIKHGQILHSWEQRKLGDLGSVSMCRRIFKHQTSESGEIPFFKIGTFGGEPDAFITRELFEEFKAKYPYPDKGDILISASGSIGRTVEFTGENEYFQDSNIVWLKHDKSIINPFLRHLYSVVEWAGIEGSTIKRLYNDNILKTEVMLPSVQEQTKIADMLDGIDSLITLHQRGEFYLTKGR